MKKGKKNSTSEKHFYLKWWFWAIIIVLFTITWIFLLISDIDLRTSIIGICGIWGSTIATIFIGIISVNQNKHYEFVTKKNEIINSIRMEERLFLEDFSLIGDLEIYTDYVLFLVYNTEHEDPRKRIEIVTKHRNLVNKITNFMDKILIYEYGQFRADELMKNAQKMYKYLFNQLNPSKVPNILSDEFKEKYANSAKFLSKWIADMTQLKNESVYGYQLFINAIDKCTNLNALENQHSKILNGTKNMREKIKQSLFKKKSKQSK